MQTLCRIILVCIACYGSAASAENIPLGDPGAIQTGIRILLEANSLAIDGEDILAEDVVRQVYQDNNFKPFWTDSRNIRKLLSLIEEAPDHGLLPDDYNIVALRRILDERERDPAAMIAAESDLMLTESLLRYAYHRRLGKIKPSTLDPDINYKRETFRNQPPGETLREILEAPSLQEYIDLVAPSGPYYTGLQHWLRQYRQIAAAGGWANVPEGPTLRLGDIDPRVAAIRARLEVTGELPARRQHQLHRI